MVELGVEVVDVGLGELVGELGEGALGLLLPFEGGEAYSSQAMHLETVSTCNRSDLSRGSRSGERFNSCLLFCNGMRYYTNGTVCFGTHT